MLRRLRHPPKSTCSVPGTRGSLSSINMKTILIAFHLFLIPHCSSQLTVLSIESSPPSNGSVVSSEEGMTVSLTCLVENVEVYPGPELRWLRNKSPVLLQEENRLTRSSLCLESVSRDDHGVTFTCQLHSNASVNASMHLQVFFTPEFSGTENVTAEEGSSVTLVCDTYSNPQVTVSWQQNGEALDLSSGGFVLVHDRRESRLSMAQLQRSIHEAQYSCMVSSPMFGTRTKFFLLTVEDMKMKFPLAPTIAGLVVVVCTALLAFISRWKRITKCCR
ncbi:transmembrane and immunoglobulin domain-containing protein 1 isoform X1 [Paramormyrops kingsleyae]|uniref:transmembrane and immunoglobulin domain-containing protein 1 isoform X1 n=2 Tax=Paramormyrops kingsleyae TaxID=1676925 RepID=UPI003B96C266